ncbi:MAG: quinolinate synthase NadA, partial [Actinomycetes bacterium]
MTSINTAIQLMTREDAERSAQGGTCSPDLARSPWEFDLPAAGLSAPEYGPGASMRDSAPASTPRQGVLPEEYRLAGDAELEARIVAAKETLGDRLVVLGHFYQRDEVVKHADFVGDSFQLANAALTRPDAEAIVFCGVHFMAETADILSRPEQNVILPNLAAGCSMADMADLDSVTECWEQLEELYGTEPDDSGRIPVLP